MKSWKRFVGSIARQLSSLAVSSERRTVNGIKPFDSIPGPKPLPLIGNKWRYLPLIGSDNQSCAQVITRWLHLQATTRSTDWTETANLIFASMENLSEKWSTATSPLFTCSSPRTWKPCSDKREDILLDAAIELFSSTERTDLRGTDRADSLPKTDSNGIKWDDNSSFYWTRCVYRPI